MTLLMLLRSIRGRKIGSIEPRRVDRSCEVGHEDPLILDVQREPYSFHEMREDDLRILTTPRRRIHPRAIHRIPAWGIAAIRPVHRPRGEIESEVDRARQAVEEYFDVAASARAQTVKDGKIAKTYHLEHC